MGAEREKRRRLALRRSALLLFMAGCSEARPPATPVASGAPDVSEVRAEDWAIPRFFELGEAVRLRPGGSLVNTLPWLETLRREGSAHPNAHLRAASDPVFVYTEPDPERGAPKQLALVLPPDRPFSSNGLVTAYWDQAPEAFNLGVERSRGFGALTLPASAGPAQVRGLKALFEYSGTNIQDLQVVYQVDGESLNLFEHRGLVPGLPISFEQFVLYDRRDLDGRAPIVPVRAAEQPLTLTLGLRPSGAGWWQTLESLELEGHRVLVLTDPAGDVYFLAAPLALASTWHFGDLASDLVVDALQHAPPDRAQHRAAAALIIPRATSGLVLSGRVADRAMLGTHLRQAVAFLDEHEQARRDFAARGERSQRFLRHYAHAFLQSHRSQHDPRRIMELPYGDAFYPSDVVHSSANVWYGSDQASVLTGLVHYYRTTRDAEIVPAIAGITESSIEAMTPSGSVWMKRFDEMLVTKETDANTGRADAFIDNGGVAVNFNHRRLVLRRGYERIAGVTWGAFGAVVDGRLESVDDPRYQFAVDSDSVPRHFRTDQESLSVARWFWRDDGALKIREIASVARGIPGARIRYEVENTGETAVKLEQLRLTVGDFFHYGDGSNEISQNRYGFSRVFEGVPLHVGLWMEGMSEPLWGDNFPPGWVDVTEHYRRHRSRFLVIYGYDKAQIYHLPERADRVLLYNIADQLPEVRAAEHVAAPALGGKDGYRGWTRLELQYDVGRALGPGETQASPAIDSYTLWVPLFSADSDTVPDELQSLGPRWVELVEASARSSSLAALRRDLAELPDRARADRIESLLHTSIESDYAYTGMQAAWMEAADLFRDLSSTVKSREERSRHAERARRAREAALRGAEFSLRAMTHLRNRFDLMPAFGIMRYYGFHVFVFDWAYRETCDPRFRDAMTYMADRIARSERDGGLQVTDPAKPNYGGYVINEFSRAAGANNLDDQGIKLWALRLAFERTRDERYRRSAELCIDHWIKVRPSDHHFYGISKSFDRYVPTGLDQQRTPYGHYTLLIGLKSWSDLHARARELHARGLRNATERHLIHAVGVAGAYYMVFPDEGMVHFGTNAELGGTFLWALAFDARRLQGSWSRCAARQPALTTTERRGAR